MKPAAIEKAESLAKFAAHCGQPFKDFGLALTRAEAYEMLDFLADGGLGPPCELLLKDIETARQRGNPWEVLCHFNLHGFTLGPAEALH